MEDRSVAAVERALVAIRRSQSRRTLSRLARQRGEVMTVDPTVIAVLDAVEAAQPCAVGAIGEALGVDQPRASRLVARAVTDGLLARDADQGDGRRALLTLTAAGRDRLDEVRRFRRETVTNAMSAWSGHDRAEFARLLTAFVDAFADLTESGHR